MKILLISDTHGTNIDRISAYAAELDADLCIHAGDFGFYDATSADALSQRELYLLIEHSPLPDDEKASLLKENARSWKEAVIRKRLLGNFPDFLADKMRFLKNIGNTTAVIQTGKFTVALKNKNASDLKAYALSMSGERIAQIPVRFENNKAVIFLDTAKTSAVFFELATM